MARIHDFKTWVAHNEGIEDKESRRKFIKNIFKTVGVTFVSTMVLKTIYQWIANSYGDEAETMVDAKDLSFSEIGEKLITNYYKDYVSRFDSELDSAKSEVKQLFKNVSKPVVLNQKMYDALVMICFRAGTETFINSDFVKFVKNSDYVSAVQSLRNDELETMWNCKKLDWVKTYEITLFSSFAMSSEEDPDQEPSSTAGITTQRPKNLVQLNKTNYSHVKYDLDKTQYDFVNKSLLDDIQEAAKNADIIVTITTAKSGHSSFWFSRHRKNIAVDIAILNGEGSYGARNAVTGNPNFRKWGNQLKDELVKLGYVWNTEAGNDKSLLWQTNKGGNHFNHLHVSRKS